MSQSVGMAAYPTGMQLIVAYLCCHCEWRGRRPTLFHQHLGAETAPLDDRHALQVFLPIARANRDTIERGAANWQGLVSL
jgi:hypothetical protein